MKTFSNLSTFCHLLGAFALTAAMTFVADEAMARVAVTKITTSATGGVKRDGRGPQKREITQLSCMGLPTYITTDAQNKTQVYVYDGENPEQYNENNIVQIATEEYRVEIEEDEDWRDISLFFGGDAGSTVPNNPILVMDNGMMGDILLGGYYADEDKGKFSPTLTIKGGWVKYISVIGRYDSPLEGATINLSNMTYTGAARINLARAAESVQNGATYTSEYKYDNVTYTCENCSFITPEANPLYSSNNQQCPHRYYISEVIPDPVIVTDGVLSVACKICDQTWENIHFGIEGVSGPDWDTPWGYAYFVKEGKTLVPPTCQPGKAIYTITLKFQRNQYYLKYNYVGKIPPVEDVHDWSADGICHHTHYQMQRDANGKVMKDEVENILYVCDEDGNPAIDETEYRASQHYVRKNQDLFIPDENGKIQYNWGGYRKSYRTWTTTLFDDAKDAYLYAAGNYALHDKQVVIGFTDDFNLNSITTTRPVYPFQTANEGTIFELHGHTLSATNTDNDGKNKYRPIVFTEQSVTMRNGMVNANFDLAKQNGSTNKFNLQFENMLVNTEMIESDTITLVDNSTLYASPLYNIDCDNIVTDETSMWCTPFPDDTPLAFAENHTVQNLLYTRTVSESLAGKWQALMVPFSIKMTQEVLDACDIAELYMISTKGSSDSGTSEGGHDQPNVAVLMKYDLNEYTPASTPLFIRPKQAGTLSILQSEAEIEPSDNIQLVSCATTKDSYELHGVYDGSFVAPDNDGISYYAPYNGSLTLFTGRLSHANRWYMTKTSKSNNANQAPLHALLMQTYGEDDINDINIIEVALPDNDNTYTLEGIDVTGKHLTPGFYIKGNKKIVVK